ncbi:malonate decarboxylase holo-ACP synthase [Serratia sp. JUb9]|uniref:malonate decarboxylase holo-ACP synthase n=1 Tax=unclassified Serratia (in: enterobacteria) TaxID=2647522 RepID=UPI000CF713DF|nr:MULTISPECIES: malonate decarboxylase holo-ACP synthase [unclassified Serratia (in: enterobacteria)]AVJ19162.1 phosphoribosyl-dephospho-CoA transferase [Serratia sp. MYb239]QNK33311.1 malonate decarboxylase holo-ACP synthase [Serratia sp. JUb9]SQJ09126.1 Phosphoribosyl-dephospho-CoA transferase [Serratia rubidaea]
MIRPHDLLWTESVEALIFPGASPTWVARQQLRDLPLVVRRDMPRDGAVPVGIRGETRAQRAAAWLPPAAVRRRVTPESLVAGLSAASPFAALPPVRALRELAAQPWRWAWGVTGSCGYALATGLPVMHPDSDLDLTVRCPQPVGRAALHALAQRLRTLPCRVDLQVETPYGGFALNEWLRDGRVLLKTNGGPYLTDAPWSAPQE